jgi:hypothetical protein
MRSILGMVVLCALGRVVAADADVNWDGTYAVGDAGGGELCPHSVEHSSMVVANSTFSIVWNIRSSDDRLIRVGTIDGSVRPSGFATVKATLLQPMPAAAMAALKQMDDDVDKLKAIANDVHIVFQSHHDRTIELTAGGDCSLGWHAEEAAKGAKPQKQEQGTKSKPPALTAGSAKWDMTYVNTSGSSQDWRCPKIDFKDLVVSKGRFSFPYVIEARDGHGHDYGDVTLGQIDGSIAANGKVTLRTWFSVTELPPEIADSRKADKVILDYVRAFIPTMTFSTHGAARLGDMTYGNDACEIQFESKSTFKQGRSVAPSRKGNADGATCSRDSECKSDNCTSGHCDAHSPE